MKKFFKFVGTVATVAGIMVVGGIADRHSEKFGGIVNGAEKGLKTAKDWIKGVVQPK